MSRLIFAGIGIFIVARLMLADGIKAASTGLAAVVLLGSMVWFSGFWAQYILPLGFWQSLASDARTPERSAAAIALMGWIFLVTLGVAAYLVP